MISYTEENIQRILQNLKENIREKKFSSSKFPLFVFICGEQILDENSQIMAAEDLRSKKNKRQYILDAIDEIKELEDSFEKMLERMNSSIIQEKKAYALALQAQMNPHFLYNMLAVISSAGSEAGCDSVSTMCVELSDMLRYVAAYQKVTVPLKEEILHTKNYLALMKSRYEDYFSYKIDVSDDLMNIPVPKLFIQPLAENCFIHAFKEKEPPWNIDIKMIGTKDRWELIIKDNGSGISEERIAEIKDKIDKALNERQVGNIGGLGIVNTIVRLTMTHNKNLKYDIYNDNGMEIKIVAGE